MLDRDSRAQENLILLFCSSSYDSFYTFLIFEVVCKLMCATCQHKNVYKFLFYLRILLGKDLKNSSLTEIGQWLLCELEV